MACTASPEGAECRSLVANLANPFYRGDEAALTQVSGWTGAWTASPSAYVVAAQNADQVAAAVRFAASTDLRLVVKGGGHSYQGTSCAPDSLLIWTRAMNAIELDDAFLAQGCEGRSRAVPAVSVGAGAVWMDVYDVVSTKAGRYVQGGGCATVGVAGLVQSGGFGSFSKAYGLAAAGLLEAEIVTADGVVRTVNACRDPDLYWAIKGGGGGSFGVVTRLTLATHALPASFGDISVKLAANSDDAFRRLVTAFVRFYADNLLNPHWGESVRFSRRNRLAVDMVFQGLEKTQAEGLWRGFIREATQIPGVTQDGDFFIETMPAQRWWDVDYLQEYSKGSVEVDPRPGAPRSHGWWTGDSDQVGEFIHAYHSLWLPADLVDEDRRQRLADALFAASRHWSVSLHFNKGLAGAPAEAISAARDTAINPAACGAFALAIISGGSAPRYDASGARDPDADKAPQSAAEMGLAMKELLALAPAPASGSYVSESSYFLADWQQAYWGMNYERLRAVKDKYDPTGLFFVHQGVGSEGWSEDGFERSPSSLGRRS